MKKWLQIIILSTMITFFGGCTQVVTAPVSIATTAAGVTYDATSAVVGAAIPDDDKE